MQTLTVKPLGVVLDRPLEGVHLLAGVQVEEVSAEDHSVRLAVLRHTAAVQARQVAGVALI